MKSTLRIILLLFFLSLFACNSKKDLLKGTWIGYYNSEEIVLEFKSDSLIIDYKEYKRKVSQEYKFCKDLLILQADTLKIKTLTETDLILRPNKNYQVSVLTISLIDFKRR